MKRTITQLLGIGLIIGLSPRTAKAQNWLGMSNSNYGGIHTVYQNPSNIADRKSYASFNFYSLGANLQNNYLTYNAPFKATHWDDENRDNDFRDGWFLESLNGNAKDFSFTSESRGLSMVIPWGKNADLAFHSRTRVGVQASNIDEWTARILKYGIDSNANSFNGNKKLIHGKKYTTGEMSLNADAYQELNASLAGVLYRGKKNFLKGGFTLKFLRGLGGANLYANNVNTTIFNNDSIQMQGGTMMFNHTSSNDLKNTLGNTDGAWWNNAAGYGLGLDLGLTYEYRPKGLPKLENCNYRNQHSNYKFKIGLALTDIGGINYFKKATNMQFDMTDTGYININSNVLDDFKGNDNGFEKIDKTLAANLKNSTDHSFYSQLPTAININMDYKVSKNIYVAANWYQNVKSKEATGLRQASYLSISPRLETSLIELGMPITIAKNYSKVNLGLNARVGPFFIGTENIGGLMKMSGSNNFKGADLYGGVSLNIGRCWVNKEKKKRKKYKDEEEEKVKEKEIIERTILKHDTIYITKTKVIEKTTEIIRLENELKKQKRLLSQKDRELIILKETRGKVSKDAKVLAELKRREADLDKREKELRSKSSCKDCEDELAYIKLERRNLKNRISVLENQVRQLQKDVAYWKNRHRQTEIQLEIVRRNCKKSENDEIRKNREIEDLRKSAEEKEKRAQLQRERERQKRIEAEAKKKRDAEARRKAQIKQQQAKQAQVKRQQELEKKRSAEEKEKRAQLQRERERQKRIETEAKKKRDAEARRKAQIKQQQAKQAQVKRQQEVEKKRSAEEKEKRAQLQRERERQKRLADEAKRKKEEEARKQLQKKSQESETPQMNRQEMVINKKRAEERERRTQIQRERIRQEKIAAERRRIATEKKRIAAKKERQRVAAQQAREAEARRQRSIAAANAKKETEKKDDGPSLVGLILDAIINSSSSSSNDDDNSSSSSSTSSTPTRRSSPSTTTRTPSTRRSSPPATESRSSSRSSGSSGSTRTRR